MNPPDIPGAPIWGRRQGETRRAFQAFTAYIKLGHGRTLAQTADGMGIVARVVEEWSRRWGWIERGRAWQDEQDRLDAEALQGQRVEARKRHAQLGRAMVATAAKGIMQIHESGAPLAPEQIARLGDTGVKIERVALGEIDQPRIDVRTTVDVRAESSTLEAREDRRIVEAVYSILGEQGAEGVDPGAAPQGHGLPLPHPGGNGHAPDGGNGQPLDPVPPPPGD